MRSPILDWQDAAALAAIRARVGGYVEVAPPPALAGIVECTWLHSARESTTAVVVAWHRVLPDDALSLAHICRRASDGRVVASELAIIGPVARPRLFPIVPGDEIAAVKVRAEWAPTVLGAFPADHEDGITKIDDPETEGRLAATKDWHEAVAQLWRVVLRRLAATEASLHSPDPAQRAVLTLRAAPARSPVRWSADRLGISTRHLRRLVTDAVGRSPKSLARTWRFLGALSAADLAGRPNWAAVAANTGYTDQAHLVKEFRTLTGTTPDRVLAERRAESLAYAAAL